MKISIELLPNTKQQHQILSSVNQTILRVSPDIAETLYQDFASQLVPIWKQKVDQIETDLADLKSKIDQLSKERSRYLKLAALLPLSKQQQ